MTAESPYVLAWAKDGASDLEGKGQTIAWRPPSGGLPGGFLNMKPAKGKGRREVTAPPETPSLEVAPRLDMVNRLLISGQSGAGKSYFAGCWLQTFLDWAGPRDVFIFSKVAEDESLDEIEGAQRVDLSELPDDPIQVEDLAGAVALFDDVDTISNKKELRAVQDLRNDVLQTGRHDKIQVLTINHLLTNGSETRKALTEATAVVLFPRAGTRLQATRYLRDYCGFERPLVRKIMSVPSRWVYVARTFPPYVVHERGAFLI